MLSCPVDLFTYKTGTVPFGEIVYNSSGLLFKKISFNSIVKFEYARAILARIA